VVTIDGGSSVRFEPGNPGSDAPVPSPTATDSE
jgi:hypothetical protein